MNPAIGNTRRFALNLEIHVGPLSGTKLIRDFLRGAEEVAPYYPGFPWDIEAYRRKLDDVDSRFGREERLHLASMIRATSPGAAARLEEVVAGNGVFVTTGQQAGLFTGPLYTIYKALTAVRLAATLERALDRPVVPLFWVASDDHDWEEVNHVDVLDRKNILHRISLPAAPDAPPVSMRNRRLGPEIETTLDQFIEALPTTEFAGDLLNQLREAYRPGRTVAEAFEETIADLLAPLDLLIIDGGQPALKQHAAGLIARELEHAAEHEALFAERSRQLEKAGYHAQVPPLAGGTNVFFEDESGRERVFRDGATFVLRQSGHRFERSELLDLVNREPARFSANVVLRPIVENAVLPTIAYVGGPGEVSYYAQYGPLFEAHGIGMPVVFPRHSVRLIEAKVRKVLDRFRLDPEDFRQPSHELAARVLRQELPEEVRAAISDLRRMIAEGYERLAMASQEIDPTLKGPLQGARNSSFVQLAEAEKKILRLLKKQNDLGLDQLDKAAANLFPNRQPQERVLNVYQYLVRYGTELFFDLVDRMEISLGSRVGAEHTSFGGSLG